ncbi:sigma-70 family RNA polymerase sigma factor [Mucilaginibacter sp. UC70_90]
MLKASPSDSDLWKKIVLDDYRAFTVLFDRYWFVLYKTASKYIKDHELCEEAVHDLFFNIWNRRKYLDIEDFNGYLKTSIRYQVYRLLKSRKAQAVTYVEEYPEELTLAFENDGKERILYQDLEKEMEDRLNQLTKRTAEIFLLSRKDHLSNDEIAKRLGISKRSVENQVTKALKFLKNYYNLIMILWLYQHF